MSLSCPPSPSRRVGVLVLALVLPVSCGSDPLGPPSDPFDGQGAELVVVCHRVCDPGERLLAEEAARQAWTAVEAMVGRPIALRRTARVHLRSLGDFREVDQKLNGGRFRDQLGFTDYGRNESNLAVAPPVPVAARAVIPGLTPHTLRLLAHETAHLAQGALVPDVRHLPDAISEGVAVRAARRAVVAVGLSDSGAGDPFYSTYLHRAEGVRVDGDLPGVRELLLEGSRAVSGVGDAYAVRAVVIQLLQEEHPGLLKALLEAAAEVEGSSDRAMQEGLAGALNSYGRSAAVEARFPAFVRERAAAREWIELGRFLYTPPGDPWTQIPVGDGALTIRRRTDPGLPAAIRGRVELLPGYSGSAGVVLGWRGDGGWLVSVAPGGMAVERLEGDRIPLRTDRSTVLAESDGPLAVGRPLEIELIRREDILRVTVDGTTVEALLGPKVATGESRWGLWVDERGGARWHDLRVSPEGG